MDRRNQQVQEQVVINMEDPINIPSSSSSSYYYNNNNNNNNSFFDHSLFTTAAAASDPTFFDDDHGGSIGFMELLAGVHDFCNGGGGGDFQEGIIPHRDPPALLLPPPAVSVETQQELSSSSPDQLQNAPATPNYSNSSSISSESIVCSVPIDHEQLSKSPQDEETPYDYKTNKQLKVKKTSNQTKKKKKEKEPRFAFMTKSEVDHLEDGFRWRKYGQKAVKNSPFPRSYYRCTTSTCNVKKRVERCFNDPSIVVTTYEGQHTHPTPMIHRPTTTTTATTIPHGFFLTSPTTTTTHHLHQQQLQFNNILMMMQQQQQQNGFITSNNNITDDVIAGGGGGGAPVKGLLRSEDGLLQDIVS